MLLAARDDRRDKVLGLFNQRPVLPELVCLWLGESGDRTLDSIFIEHNGLLTEAGATGKTYRRLPACRPHRADRRRATAVRSSPDAERRC